MYELGKKVHIHLQSAPYPSISHSHLNDTQVSFFMGYKWVNVNI